MYEDTDKHHGIDLEPKESRGKIAGVTPSENPVEIPGVAPPENPVELPGVASLENEVDADGVPPLFSSDYDRNDESDDKNKDTYTSMPQLRRVFHPGSMPPTVRNVYNLCLRNQTDYVKKNIDRLM